MKPRIPTTLEIEYDCYCKAQQAEMDAKYAKQEAEFRLKEQILLDENLTNYVMTVSYAKLRRWMKHNGQ